MKKAIIALVLLIVIGFIPIQQHNSVSIRSNYFDVCQQLMQADNWKRWEPEINGNAADQVHTQHFGSAFLIETPDQLFNITSISANTFKVIVTRNHVGHHYFYTVAPGIKNNDATVIIDAKTNVFKWLIAQFQPSAQPAALMLSLKSFMENPKQYYGFNISEKNVTESYFAVKKETISTKHKFPEIRKAAEELNTFIGENNIKAIQPVSGSYYPHKVDSLQILIGIPVNKQISSTSDITFMRMPGGKVIVGDYAGKYNERQKIYTAMEKYMQDHSLLKQVAPFERYLNNKVPESDTDIVNMQVNYPVL
jgi:effector-binding domain-containing protein